MDDYSILTKNLFDEYAQRYTGEITLLDGILDLQKWNDSPTKLLIIAKEAHRAAYPDIEEFNNDISAMHKKWAEECSTDQQLRKLYTTVLGIHHHSDAIYPWDDDYGTGEWKRGSDSMLKSAFINLKKIFGESQSNDSDIHKHTLQNKDLLKNQIKYINPTIILCSGTFKYIEEHLYDIEPYNDIQDAYIAEGIIFLDFYHFAFAENQDNPFEHAKGICGEIAKLNNSL